MRTPTIPRNSLRKRVEIGVDELVLFQAVNKIVDVDSIPEYNSPENFTFKRLDNNVQLFNLKSNEKTGIPAVHECITIDRQFHIFLSYHGLVIPLREWF